MLRIGRLAIQPQWSPVNELDLRILDESAHSIKAPFPGFHLWYFVVHDEGQTRFTASMASVPRRSWLLNIGI